MLVKDIINSIEEFAPVSIQESYDNSGLLTGELSDEVNSVLLTIDITEEVIDEAIEDSHNMIISHHPLLFKPISKILPDSYINRCLIKAIKHDIAIYSAHTNIDAVINGVSGRMADKLELINRRVLQPKGDLYQLSFYTPESYAEKVRMAISDTGAGYIGEYSHCSFNQEGIGTFQALENANPFVGEKHQIHNEKEIKTEITVPAELLNKCIDTLRTYHPYEEPVWNIIPLKNNNPQIGFGIIGELEEDVDSSEFLDHLKNTFHSKTIRHTSIHKPKIKKIALCGGSGSFLTHLAIKEKADIYISGDFKYHDFFNTENRIILADIGHYESEQFTKEIFYELVTKKLSKFAVQFSKINTNPINYL